MGLMMVMPRHLIGRASGGVCVACAAAIGDRMMTEPQRCSALTRALPIGEMMAEPTANAPWIATADSQRNDDRIGRRRDSRDLRACSADRLNRSGTGGLIDILRRARSSRRDGR